MLFSGWRKVEDHLGIVELEALEEFGKIEGPVNKGSGD